MSASDTARTDETIKDKTYLTEIFLWRNRKKRRTWFGFIIILIIKRSTLNPSYYKLPTICRTIPMQCRCSTTTYWISTPWSIKLVDIVQTNFKYCSCAKLAYTTAKCTHSHYQSPTDSLLPVHSNLFKLFEITTTKLVYIIFKNIQLFCII